MICKICGVNNNPGAKFCTNCGEELGEIKITSDRFCPSCGSRNDATNKFCTSCGSLLQDKISSYNHPRVKESSKKSVQPFKINGKIHNRKSNVKKKNVVNIYWIAAGVVIALVLLIIVFNSGSSNESISSGVTNVSPLTTDWSLQQNAWNKLCPIEGDPVYSSVSTTNYNGKIFGFCCADCKAKFIKEPEKYSRQLSADGTKFIGN